MTTSLKDIYNGQPGTTNTTLFTAGANSFVKILSATVTNDTTTAAHISLHRVVSGGSAGDANIIVNQKVVGSRESVPLWEIVGQALGPGDFLSAIAETANQLTVHISGIEVV